MNDNNSFYKIKIGNTTFVVCIKRAEDAKKPIDKVFYDMCKRKVLSEIFNLDETKKYLDKILPKCCKFRSCCSVS